MSEKLMKLSDVPERGQMDHDLWVRDMKELALNLERANQNLQSQLDLIIGGNFYLSENLDGSKGLFYSWREPFPLCAETKDQHLLKQIIERAKVIEG